MKSSRQSPGIHAYVNCLLGRISKVAGVEKILTSHFFRRGGAQHANGHSDLALQGIVDRGGWNLSTQVKAFMYIFNTTQEDQRVAKVLSGHAADAKVPPLSLSIFDVSTLERVTAVKNRLFACCIGLGESRFNVSAVVVDTLCAYLIKSYPEIKLLNPVSPLVVRVEEVMDVVEVESSEWIAWSNRLQNIATEDSIQLAESRPAHLQMLKQQGALIEELIGVNQKLVDPVRIVEAKLEGKPTYSRHHGK